MFVASLTGTSVIVGLYALGTRLLAAAGMVLNVEPAEFTDAITVVSPERAAKARRKAARARTKNALTPLQKSVALCGAITCFVLCVLAILFGLYLLIPYFHA